MQTRASKGGLELSPRGHQEDDVCRPEEFATPPTFPNSSILQAFSRAPERRKADITRNYQLAKGKSGQQHGRSPRHQTVSAQNNSHMDRYPPRCRSDLNSRTILHFSCMSLFKLSIHGQLEATTPAGHGSFDILAWHQF